jgi:ATP-dependent helicase/nuclease subunit B
LIQLCGEDGKYLRIIDYKSSSKNIDLNEVYAGLQIQLLTYSDAICKEEDIMPAGIFYFSLLEQMVKADKKISDEEIEEQIRKDFRMKGLILADIKIIKMNDNTLTSGSSKLVPAAITSSGTVNEKWTNGVNKEEFKILQDYIDYIIKQI